MRRQPSPPGRAAWGLVIAAVAIAAVLLIAAGGFAAYLLTRPDDARHEGMGPPERGTSGPVDLLMPLEFFPVADERPGDVCPPGYLPEGTGGCLLLGSGGFRVARVDALKTVPPESTGSWGVEIRLTGDDAKAFARLTEQAAAEPPGRRIAILVDERIVAAPMVNEPVRGGEIMITGNYTRAEVDDLVERITGR
ncbi:SecDF P1 head subdomain-containing protein [Actinomadura sediminis]|uniref:SecDF P1 head subdomain domain-containing protein n=1 Tax=Actinomadura sediminis TaxID=1038904 RepID=A0ABW3EX22_9ACTN